MTCLRVDMWKFGTSPPPQKLGFFPAKLRGKTPGPCSPSFLPHSPPLQNPRHHPHHCPAFPRSSPRLRSRALQIKNPPYLFSTTGDPPRRRSSHSLRERLSLLVILQLNTRGHYPAGVDYFSELDAPQLVIQLYPLFVVSFHPPTHASANIYRT